jgi:hypothetical protein
VFRFSRWRSTGGTHVEFTRYSRYKYQSDRKRAQRSLVKDMSMMKKLALAVGLLACGVADASAQSVTLRFGPQPPPPVWSRDAFPYESRRHDICQRKAWRLREYERYASADGRLSWRERRELASLRSDLDRTCGRVRWRG